MRRFILSLLISATIPATLTRAAGDADYTNGIIIVNEDWYGHQNSTVNFLCPDAADGNYWQYRIIQAENPGVELGCTNQYGAIWYGRLYLIAKQAKDPGADITGGRITVVDAKTMKLLHQQELIDPSGAQCGQSQRLHLDKQRNMGVQPRHLHRDGTGGGFGQP